MKVIGDSHALMFTYHGIHCGPRTAFKLLENHSKILDHINYLRDSDEKIGVLFGEIDCRIHIWYQSQKKNIPTHTLIFNTVLSYIEYLKNLYHNGFDVHFVLELPPAAEEENIYGYEYYPDHFNRMLITHHFNRILCHCAYASGFHFVRWTDAIVGSNYRVKKGFLMPDLVHIYSDKIKPIIMEEINKIINVEHPNAARRIT